ncbi:DNA repair protein RecN [Fundidesulfovibrio butyratiphilus]
MIELLRIRNLALIADVELEFSPGLNVLTGETGAGKTFILKALEFLTGERLNADMVRAGASKALVEALFVLDGRELIVRRELSAETGRARIFLDGQLATQEAVRELKPRLILHASQNGQQKLLSPTFQARLLDHALPEPGLLDRRDALVRRTTAVGRELEDLRERLHHLDDRREVLEMQRTEIDKVAPREGEEEELMEREKSLRESRKAREALDTAMSLLLGDDGLVGAMGRLEHELAVLDQADARFAEDLESVRDMRHTLGDLASRLRQGLPEAEGDPEVVEARLWELSQLKRKLKRSLPEILGLSREIEENLSFLDSAGLDLKRLERARREHREELAQVLERLDACRRETAEALARRIEEELRGLGFSEHVRVLYEFTPGVLFAAEDGLPAVVESSARLLFAPNPGQPPQPLDRIASGGELSRFLLALTSLRAESDRSTLIFDEVDAGIGGLTLTRVGERLRALAADHQMLLITHWPQLAALAGRHFLVNKHVEDGQTETTCSRLEGESLRAELSRMAGGRDLGEALAGKLLDGKANAAK